MCFKFVLNAAKSSVHLVSECLLDSCMPDRWAVECEDTSTAGSVSGARLCITMCILCQACVHVVHGSAFGETILNSSVLNALTRQQFVNFRSALTGALNVTCHKE